MVLQCFPSLISPQVAPEHPPGTWNSMVVTTHAFYDYMMRNARRLQEASFILVNTFEDLEGRFLDLMRSEVIGKPNVQVSTSSCHGLIWQSYASENGFTSATQRVLPGAILKKTFMCFMLRFRRFFQLVL